MTNKDKSFENGGDCVVPDGIIVPPEDMHKYATDPDFDLEMDIRNYVSGQASDETVLHIEKVKTEYILRDKYEIWDVTTDKSRWWVITNLTNLYSQEHFPSLDYTLSFHIGLMMRMRSRGNSEAGNESHPLDEVLRRIEQADEMQIRAIESEDHQAIGMQLREALVSLANTIRMTVPVTVDNDVPKGSDFVGWMNLFLDKLCAGSSAKPLRQYLKRASKETWQLVNWLTHYRHADTLVSSIAVESCGVLFGHFAQLLYPKRGKIEECPTCNSRNIRSHFDINIAEDGDYYSTCGKCGWSNHPEQ